MKKATEEKDERQVHILNTFKANYEQVVRFTFPCPVKSIARTDKEVGPFRSITSSRNVIEGSRLLNEGWRKLLRKTIGLLHLYVSGLTQSARDHQLRGSIRNIQMREVGEIEGAYQAAMAEVEQLGKQSLLSPTARVGFSLTSLSGAP